MANYCVHCGAHLDPGGAPHHCAAAQQAPPLIPAPHPKATPAMVLGILGLCSCLVLAPLAWVIGGRAVREIDAAPGHFEGRSRAQAGRIMGIVGTCLAVLTVLAVAVVVILAAVQLGSDDESDDASRPGGDVAVGGQQEPDDSSTTGQEVPDDSSPTEADRRSATDFAEGAAKVIVDSDYRNYAAHQDQARALMTPAFASEFLKTSRAIEERVIAEQAIHDADVLGVGLVDIDSERAHVLLFIDQDVAKGVGEQRTTAIQQTVVVMDLEQHGRTWLVGGLETVGGGGPPTSPVRESDQERRNAISVAEQLVEALSNVDHRDLDTSVDDVLEFSTGGFREQYVEGLDGLRASVLAAHTVMESEVVAVGLSRFDANSAEVVVATVGTVTNDATGSEPQVRTQRLLVSLTRVDGEWLVSDLQYV